MAWEIGVSGGVPREAEQQYGIWISTTEQAEPALKIKEVTDYAKLSKGSW